MGARMIWTEDFNIAEEAIEIFGEAEQLNQAQEEAAELIVAINKYRRTPTPEAILEVKKEIIDNYIMLEQLCHIFDLRGKESQGIVDEKIEKLRGYLEAGKK